MNIFTVLTFANTEEQNGQEHCATWSVVPPELLFKVWREVEMLPG